MHARGIRPWCDRRLVTRGVLALLLVGPAAATPGLAQDTGQLFIAVTGSDGQPVIGLTAADFRVEVDGVARPIVAVDPGTTPMKIALLVDNGDGLAQTNAVNPMRDGLNAFLDTLHDEHAVAMFTIARNIQRRVDFTTDPEELRDAVGNVFAERGAGALMIDGVKETWERRFDEGDAWPVMVLVLTDGTETSGFVSESEYTDLVNSLIDRGATVHAVMLSSRGGNIQTEYSINLTQNTGGVYRAIAAPTGLRQTLTDLATRMNEHFDEMAARYRVVYEQPDEPGTRIGAAVSRSGVTIQVFGDRRMQP